MMKNRGAVPNTGSKKSKGNHASLSGGSLGSGGKLASNVSSSRRMHRILAPYDGAPTNSRGAKAPSHESTPVRRGGAIPRSHESTPTSRGVVRPVLPISPEFNRTTNVVPMGGYMGLLNRMEPDMEDDGGYDDEDLGEDDDMDDGEDIEEDGVDTPHGSNSTCIPPYGTPQRPFITWVGKKFGRSIVHREIGKLVNQYLEGPWISFKEIPKENIEPLWVRFKTLYVWDSTQEQRMNTNFQNVVACRYRDAMRMFRIKSALKAIKDGHPISAKGRNFDIMVHYVPRGMHSERWVELCKQWNTVEWLKRSESGANNRNTIDSGGKISRHTGGSIGYDEHRIRLTAMLGRPPTFLELFMQTHLDKESKKKFFAGDEAAGKQFCTEKAREAYEAYSRALLEKYGDDLRDHAIDDVELWKETQRKISKGSKTNYSYGIGSSDLEAVVTGKSSAASCSSSTCESQHEVNELRIKLDTVEKDKLLMQEKLDNTERSTLEMQKKQDLMAQQLNQLMRQCGINLENPV